MAVAIICFGSLINFHQYKIWGKPLIPNFVGYKRDIEKYTKTISFSKLLRDRQHFQNDFHSADCDFSIDSHRILSGPGSLFIFNLCLATPVSNRVSSCGLRGPPIS
jgi:hypothetical protein